MQGKDLKKFENPCATNGSMGESGRCVAENNSPSVGGVGGKRQMDGRRPRVMYNYMQNCHFVPDLQPFEKIHY